jgi:hypothetical protein
VDVWIDYNGDRDWGNGGEQILTNEAVVGGVNAILEEKQ